MENGKLFYYTRYSSILTIQWKAKSISKKVLLIFNSPFSIFNSKKYTRRFLLAILVAAAMPGADLYAAGWLAPAGVLVVDTLSADTITRRYVIDPVEITARRRMADIGVQKTEVGEAVLHDNVAASMADILSQNTPVFIKSYGRATMSTASTRGTAPSHTQVSWNGMSINSPMLGMVDFSYIPSSFIDRAAVFYGASSTGAASGGLGGAVMLGTAPAWVDGIKLEYTQGISSYRTFDEFLRLDYGRRRWQGSTRVVYTSSANDFPYTNYNKKDFVTDTNGRVTGYVYPVERNKNCSYADFHALQELSFDGGKVGRFSLSTWYMDSRRGIPLLSVDWNEGSSRKAQQDDRTLRAVAGWEKISENSRLEARAGYLYSDILYTQAVDNGNGVRHESVHSQSYIRTLFGRVGASRSWHERLRLSVSVDFHQHFVDTRDEAYVPVSPEDPIGYDEARAELSGFASLRYQPTERFGAAVNLRGELCGAEWAPPVPALFVDYLISRRGNILIKASAARNYRFPTLNDLYFRPGGRYTPDLRPEDGFTYDGGVEFRTTAFGFALEGGLTAYDSYIRDWILWRPTGGGYWTPTNIKMVHSYGMEARLAARRKFRGGWNLSLDGKLAWTRSINRGEPMNEADNSVGRQLPYIPEWASSVTGRLSWRGWSLAWRWNYYSERYTSSDNSHSITGRLVPYIMNDISAGKEFSLRWGGISLRLDVNNLFGEEYESELSRPMAGRNFGIFIRITPKFR